MPMPNLTLNDALNYVYRNGSGHEWILLDEVRSGVYKYQYTQAPGEPWYKESGEWSADLITLRRFASHRIEGNEKEAPSRLIRKVRELDKRFQSRKAAHG